jgi:hypothetical protein
MSNQLKLPSSHMLHNCDMVVMVAARGCLTTLLATMSRHEGDMPWVRFVFLESLTNSVCVGPSTVKVLDPVGMDVVWVVAWPKPSGSFVVGGPLVAAGSGHVVALPFPCLSAYDELHGGWTNSNSAHVVRRTWLADAEGWLEKQSRQLVQFKLA